MKLLHLLRHAKASSLERGGTDHSRPLAQRGIVAGQALAVRLQEQGFKVDKVYCSTARRTQETYELIAPALGDTSVAYRDRLYLIDIGDLLEFIHGLPDNTQNVMIIGHNPAFHSLALDLSGEAAPGQDESLALLTEKFPTGAMCSLQFDVEHWRDVEPSGGTLMQFIRPRDISDD